MNNTNILELSESSNISVYAVNHYYL